MAAVVESICAVGDDDRCVFMVMAAVLVIGVFVTIS